MEKINLETIRFIGRVRSPLKELKDCPLQESEGAPGASILIDPGYRAAPEGLATGQEILVLSWLDRADRDILQTFPRNNRNAAITGVFAARSPDHPNPIGLHQTTIHEIGPDGSIELTGLKVLDGTPVIDIKPVL